MKSEATDWEKIFANHIFDKRLVYRTYKELSKLNNKNFLNLIREWAKGMNRHFHKEVR